MSEKLNLFTIKDIYISKYDQILKKKKDIRNILEVGDNILSHCEFWRSFIKDVNIIGIQDSLKEEKEYFDMSITILETSKYLNDEILFNLIQYCKKFDIIIFNQGNSLELCKKFIKIYSNLLEDDGLLFIENINDMGWKNDLLTEFPLSIFPNHKGNIYDLSLKDNKDKNKFLFSISHLHSQKIKIKVVYFAYLVPNKWKNIIIEQLNGLIDCGLYDESENIYLSVISNNEELHNLRIFLSSEYPKVQLINIFHENYFEYPGLLSVYDLAENDDETCILYFHSKGMTSNQHTQRHKLFKYTISEYKNWINKFIEDSNLDVIGIIPNPSGLVFYNYWWTRSSYVYNYWKKPEIQKDRFIWELWLGNIYGKKNTVYYWSPLSLLGISTTNIDNPNKADHILNHLLHLPNASLQLIEQIYPQILPPKIIKNSKPCKNVKKNIKKPLKIKK